MYKYSLLFFLGLFLITSLYAEDLDTLLTGYKKESDFSKITKRDTAGLLDLYTRDDLEHMQARNLLDILKTIPGVYLSRSTNNLTVLATPSIRQISLSYARLYINDHDVTSTSFGSAFLVWGELPIEYIDHIEVYKATSSMEFGNENAALIIRLYTKNAQHDSGSKIKLLADNMGSLNADIYTTDTLENGISYFAYGNIDNINRTVYHNEYNNHTYDFKSNKDGYNLYGDIQYKTLDVQVGAYSKRSDSFIGPGIYKTPTGGELDATHRYIHITNNFTNNIKLQLSYDALSYNRTYEDPNGIRVANTPILNKYCIVFDDEIYSAIIEKTIQTQNNKLLLGGFYKSKSFQANGHYRDTNLTYSHSNSFSNRLNLYSLYAEDTYNIDETMHIIASVKGDFYRYEKEVDAQNEYLARIGGIKTFKNIKIKLFYSQGYIPLEFYKIYNPENIPYKTNPHLKTTQTEVYSSTIEYKQKNSVLSFDFARVTSKNLIYYDRTTSNGWQNNNDTIWKNLFQLNYTYNFDLNNKIVTNFVYGNNETHYINSPSYEAVIRSFNKYKKFQFYNELIYQTSYTLYNVYVDASYDFTSAIKYQYTDDLTFGFKGENIFNKGYENSYRGLAFSIPVNDQKFWLSLEYSF